MTPPPKPRRPPAPGARRDVRAAAAAVGLSVTLLGCVPPPTEVLSRVRETFGGGVIVVVDIPEQVWIEPDGGGAAATASRRCFADADGLRRLDAELARLTDLESTEGGDDLGAGAPTAAAAEYDKSFPTASVTFAPSPPGGPPFDTAGGTVVLLQYGPDYVYGEAPDGGLAAAVRALCRDCSGDDRGEPPPRSDRSPDDIRAALTGAAAVELVRPGGGAVPLDAGTVAAVAAAVPPTTPRLAGPAALNPPAPLTLRLSRGDGGVERLHVAPGRLLFADRPPGGAAEAGAAGSGRFLFVLPLKDSAAYDRLAAIPGAADPGPADLPWDDER